MLNSSTAIFTPLHQALGELPGPLTIDLIKAACEGRVPEGSGLDFKLTPPPAKALKESDLPKDLAAMANTGGGMLIFGIRDKDSGADAFESIDPQFTDESYARDLRRVALSQITPPLFDLLVVPVSDGEERALVIVIGSSVDVPHLLYRGDLFAAPYRNGADTEWMTERMLEATYRGRLQRSRERGKLLEERLVSALEDRDTHARVWFAAVACPETPPLSSIRPTREQARATFSRALELANIWAPVSAHPLEWLRTDNPRPGLRRWRAPYAFETDTRKWREAEAQLLDDGSVVLVSAMGSGRSGAGTDFGPNEIDLRRAETFIADFAALIRSISQQRGTTIYQVRIQAGWSGGSAIIFRSFQNGFYLDADPSASVPRFSAVNVTIDGSQPDDEYADAMREMALDVVNQAGIDYLSTIL